MLNLRLLSLAALAAASPISSPQDYARALRHAARQEVVTEQEVDNFAFYAEHSGAAYCMADAAAGDKVVCGGNCPTVESDGATIVGSFTGDDTGIAGYVAVDDVRKEIVFAVRGSSNIENWIANIEFLFVDSDLTDGGKVHDGFSKAWGEMADGVSSAINDALSQNSDYAVVATGHSLGGAVATLGAAQLRNDGHAVDLYTIGSPRVGNDVLADYITNQDGAEYRVTHTDDPVPRLPPITFGYRHTSPEYWLNGDDVDGEDPPLDQIQVCDGNANVDCNAGTFGLDILAHLTYFGPVNSCIGAASKTGTVQDDDVETRINGWVQDDIDFVTG